MFLGVFSQRLLQQGSRTVCQWSVIGCLAMLAVAFQLKGFYHLTVGTEQGDAIDLRLRWCEEHYFMQGRNPFDVWLTHSPRAQLKGSPNVVTSRSTVIDPALRVCDPAHPPWGFVSGLIFFFPSWPAVRWYFACVNLVAMVVIGAWAWQKGRAYDLWTGLLWGVAVMAVGGTATALEVGQYSILVTGCLVATLWCVQHGREGIGGFLLGIAMAKPTIAGPFLLALVIHKRLRMLAVTMLYVAIASSITWLVTKTHPGEMLQQLLAVGTVISQDGSLGPITFLLAMDIPRTAATLLGMASILLAAMLVLLLSQRRTMLYSFAVASVAGRLWTYHKTYDDVMLIFLLVALGEVVHRSRDSIMPWVAFFAVGISLWVPGRVSHVLIFQIFQLMIWLVGVGSLFVYHSVPARVSHTSTG